MPSPDPRTIPPHPLLAGALNSNTGPIDALNRCKDTLILLSDLFTGPCDRQPLFDSDSARNGMWLQLTGIADVLAALSVALSNPVAENKP